MSAIKAGQLWVSDEPMTYYVAKVHSGVGFVVPVRINGTGKRAKVIADGEVRRLPLAEILDKWMPTGSPMRIPRTWHEQLLETCDEP